MFSSCLQKTNKEKMNVDESKVKSFRVTVEVADKLKAICEDFDSQNAALESMISAYEVQSARAILTDRQTDIADYDSHIQALQKAFLRSVELSENTESRIRQEFQRQLAEKDEMIADLQEHVNVAEQKIQENQEQTQVIRTEADKQISELKSEIARLNKLLTQVYQDLDEKEKSLGTTQELADILKTQVEESKDVAEELKEAEKELQEVQKMLADITKEKEYVEIEKQRALLALEREHTAEIKKLYAEKDSLREKIEVLRNELVKAETSNSESETTDIV